MNDILVLRDLEQIKAISHPYRVEVFESFDGEQPQSAKQVAEKLGEPHAKVNYHIKSLLKVGILQLVEEKVKSGIIEKYYLPTAKKLVIDKSFMQSLDEDTLQSLNQVSISLFEKISSDFYRALEGPQEQTKFINYLTDYYLTQDEVKELMAEIEELVKKKLEGKNDKSRPGVHGYNFSVLGIPVAKTGKKRS